MRPLRVALMLAASSALLLTGCTDPSPDASPEPTSESPSSEATTETETTTASETATEEALEPPFFGVHGGGVSACVPAIGDAPIAFSASLTAVDEITIDELIVEGGGDEVEVLDAFLLPYAGTSGMIIDDYPPQDPESAREDAAGYVVGAGERVIVGVGVSADGPDPVTISLGLAYTDSDGGTGAIYSGYQLTLAKEC